MENLGNISDITDTSITKRIQEIEQRTSGKVQKAVNPKIPGNSCHSERIKHKNNRNRRELIFPI